MNVWSSARDVLEAGGAWSWLVALLVALPFGVGSVWAHAAEGSGASAAALRLMEATPEANRAKLRHPFTDGARSDWHYVPRQRVGMAWRSLDAPQREAATALLRTALSDTGLDKVRAVMALEIVLRELETFSSSRIAENYALAIFGTPSSEAGDWGFRIEGHHLSLHFTLRGDRYLSTLPQFMGANPALVPREVTPGAPRPGSRVLGEEEDRARQLMGKLNPAQRAAALFDTGTYGDIVTRNAEKVSPLAAVGVKFNELAATEQAELLKLITVFADHLRPELSGARLARVRAGGLESIRFGWAGSLTRGEPYYFRIQGSSFLIEFDNSGGNHIHSVWRDFQGDWGRDVLGEHYSGSIGTHGH